MNATNCPRCNSKLSKSSTRASNAGSWLEIYVKCTNCKWEQSNGCTTETIEKLQHRLDKAYEKAYREAYQHGRPSSVTTSAIQKIMTRLAAERHCLDHKVMEASCSSR